MAKASHTIEADVSIDQFWKTIVDYEKYTQFIDGMKKVSVQSHSNGKAVVEYNIQMLGKDIFYTLEHVEEVPNRMQWRLLDSGIFKVNSGSWQLKALGKSKIQAVYELELEFKIYVPGLVLNGLVKSTLPKMLEGFVKQARKC
jgi:ribosome-associated toxin RatA of RatAB toxin-antitoxin module